MAWSEYVQVWRPKGLTLADGVLVPHMLVMSRHISSHLAQREGAAGCGKATFQTDTISLTP